MLEGLLNAQRIVHCHNGAGSLGGCKDDGESRLQQIAHILRLFFCQFIGDDDQAIGIPGTHRYEIYIWTGNGPKTSDLRMITGDAKPTSKQKITALFTCRRADALNQRMSIPIYCCPLIDGPGGDETDRWYVFTHC